MIPISKKARISLWTAFSLAPSSVVDILLGTLAMNILALALPLTLMQVYDRIIHQRAVATLIFLSIGCFIAIFFETVVHIARDRISSWCGARFEFLELSKGFEKLLHSPYNALDGERTIQRLEEINSFALLKSTYFLRSIQTLIDIPFAAANLFLIYLLVPSICLIMVYIIAFAMLSHWILSFLMKHAKKKEHSAHILRDKKVLETFRFLNTIRGFSLEEPILRRIERSQEQLAEKTFLSANLLATSTSLLLTLPQIAIFSVLMIGARDVLKHNITVGVLTTCMMLAGRVISPVMSMVSSWLQREDRKIFESGANRLFSLEDDKWVHQRTQTQDTSTATQGELSLDDVSFSFPQDTELVLNHITLQVPAKSMLVLKSDNDKSSSALAELILRNFKPKSGSIRLDNTPIGDISVYSYYQDVHSLSGHPVFFKGSILENLASFNVSKYDEVLEVCQELGVDASIANFDLGFSSPLERESLLAMSSSLLLRMAIVRALVREPKVLVIYGMDSAMDMDTKSFFIQVLARLKGECTIFCISHDDSILAMSDQIATLQDGALSQDTESV